MALTVNLANSSRGLKRLTGDMDEAVRVGGPNRAWIAWVVSAYLDTMPSDARMLDQSLRQYEVNLSLAASALNLARLGVGPPAVRHSGLSHDRWHDMVTKDQSRRPETRRLALAA